MVELPGNLDEMIRAGLAEGRYDSADEMLRVALDQLRDNRAAAADQVRRAMEGPATPSAGRKPGRPRCRSCAIA
jgi:Arc/MetJ-type ribon-helix-helix transcriptional regulator